MTKLQKIIDNLKDDDRLPLVYGNYGLWERGAIWEDEEVIWDLDAGRYVSIELIDWTRIKNNPDLIIHNDSELPRFVNNKMTQYNGWTNRDTWLTKFWLDNDENTYKTVKILFETSPQNEYQLELKKLVSNYILNETIKDPIDLSRVNWNEIIEAYQEEF